MVHFGFCYIGVIWLLMLFIPNFFWAKNKPVDYDKYVKNENKVLLALERTGEVLTCICAVIFSDLNFRRITVWSLWLLFSFVFMVLYELYWIRYFRSSKTMADMYCSFAGFPVAGASLPCLAFFTLGIYGTNIFLIISSLILSVGHIGIHLMHRREAVGKMKKRPVLTVIKIILLLPVAAILASAVTGVAGRNINWFRYYIDTSKGVNECLYIPIGGQDQYIQIRGRDVNNPVILYLHGGPGSPDSAISPLFSNGLIDSYTVVCWDQRGCGRTYYMNADEDPQNRTVNFERALSDVDDVVDYICDRFGTDKIILMGHSYGTLLGARYLRDHSDRVSAYIGIGQFVNQNRSDVRSYEDAMQIAAQRGDDASDLQAAFEAYQNGGMLGEYKTFRTIANEYHPAENTADIVGYAVFCPYTGCDDLRWLLEENDVQQFIEREMYLMMDTALYDIYDNGLTYDVPMLFISGEMDYVCNRSLVEQFYEDIEAPVKECVVISGGGHGPHYETPDQFTEAVLDFLQSI